ncbi:hypothetical protein FN846DRAFT_921701 [Sphaerosporella brunnea]|uniref:Uncharacterized protein n=1 Tax=Sphaerosporella brunnea TaxID=1250544 RepID=A0A5J5EMT6_9PEZI|nr:hypothetical protein FN846DRAFT_921701 [Sphaerosporella brunnea]
MEPSTQATLHKIHKLAVWIAYICQSLFCLGVASPAELHAAAEPPNNTKPVSRRGSLFEREPAEEYRLPEWLAGPPKPVGVSMRRRSTHAGVGHRKEMAGRRGSA